MAINGFDFKQQFGHRFYKFIKSDMKHYQFTYKLGLNVDTVPFNPTSTCKAGGLYFTNFANLANFQMYGSQIGIIEIPDDAQVYIEENKFKSNKFILHKLIDIDNESDLKKMIDIESDFGSDDCKYQILTNVNSCSRTPFAMSCKQILSKTFEQYEQQRKEQHKQQLEEQREHQRKQQRKQQRKRQREQQKENNGNDENWPILDGWRDM